MSAGKVIGVSLLAIGIISILTVIVLGLVNYTGGASGSNRFKVVCSGKVEVNPLGVGSPALDPPPQCNVDKCGLFPFSIFGSEGEVRLAINGAFHDSAGYESFFGGNRDYTVKSACIDTDGSVVANVFLYDGTVLVDNHEVIVR